MSNSRVANGLRAALVFAASIASVVCQDTLTFEAEDGVLSGTNVDTATTGFSGK
jgi:hypothetical protein